MARIDTEQVFQFCPECVALSGSRDPDCWRCGGEGMLEPYDPLLARYRLRVYWSELTGVGELLSIGDARVRVAFQTLPPEIEVR